MITNENENANEKTYNFCIKVSGDSQNNESNIEKLKEFIGGFGWKIVEITDSTFDKLDDDFWNYKSTAETLGDDGILKAASDAATKSVQKIVNDLKRIGLVNF